MPPLAKEEQSSEGRTREESVEVAEAVSDPTPKEPAVAFVAYSTLGAMSDQSRSGSTEM